MTPVYVSVIYFRIRSLVRHLPNTSTGCFRLALLGKPRHWGQSECSSLIGWFFDMLYFQQWSLTESKTPHVTLLGNAKRLTSIQVSTTAIWRPTFRERITVPTNRTNSVRNQFQPRKGSYKQRVLMHRHQGWNVRHGLCHIYMRYIYIWVVYSFCLFCCLFIIVTWWYIWCIVWQVASKRKYRHVW